MKFCTAIRVKAISDGIITDAEIIETSIVSDWDAHYRPDEPVKVGDIIYQHQVTDLTDSPT